MIARIPFGQTGHESSRVLFGAAALARVSQAVADKVLELLLQYGINHIDTAASYGDAELRIGPWMGEHRDKFFLATKTGERSYEAAYAEIQRSLERLQTNQVDLLQLHNLVDAEEWQTALGPDGALRAAKEAQAKGYVRFIGVTGHGLSVAARHLASLKAYPFASVLLPYNYNFMALPQYRADFLQLYDYCQSEQVAVQTIKSIARGRWGDKARNRSTWYEPLEDQADIDAAVAYVMSRAGLFLNSAGDVNLLPRVLEAAEKFFAAEGEAAPEPVLAGAGLQPLFPDGDDI